MFESLVVVLNIFVFILVQQTIVVGPISQSSIPVRIFSPRQLKNEKRPVRLVSVCTEREKGSGKFTGGLKEE